MHFLLWEKYITLAACGDTSFCYQRGLNIQRKIGEKIFLYRIYIYYIVQIFCICLNNCYCCPCERCGPMCLLFFPNRTQMLIFTFFFYKICPRLVVGNDVVQICFWGKDKCWLKYFVIDKTLFSSKIARRTHRFYTEMMRYKIYYFYAIYARTKSVLSVNPLNG